MTTPPAVVLRTGARVLVVDGRGRVLLVRGRDPAEPEAPEWWITPGGGVEAGESSYAAARRELAEETGLRVDDLGPPVWHRTVEFDFMGDHYRQAETFYLVRVDSHEPERGGWTPVEREVLRELRWWDLDELSASTQTVYPAALAAELRLLLEEGPPRTPKDVGP